MRLRASLRAVAAVPVLALAMLGAGALASRGDDGITSKPSPVRAQGSTGNVADRAAAVAALQDRLRRVDGDWSAWASLGSAYVQLARVSGDPSSYPKAEQALDRSDAIRKGNTLAGLGRAALAAARHDFPEAERLSRSVLAVNPYSADALAVLFDALVELGRYDQAFKTVERLNNLRPGLPAFSRASYAFELRGELVPATAAMERALASAPSPSDAAFAAYQLGELAWHAGDLETALRRYDEGLRADPDFVPLIVARARVTAAKGDTATALKGYEDAGARQPLAAVLVEQADLLRSLGRSSDADIVGEVLRAQVRLAEGNGVVVDLELALFEADHGDAANALTLARRIKRGRTSIFAEDALAWALHANGRDAEALALVRRTGRLGTRSALLAYHRGMIEHAAGKRADAVKSLREALAINPHFSPLHAATARRTLTELGG